MPEVNKILVAICFSEYCGGTFAYATRLADQLQAELIVANVIDAKDVKAISKIESMGYSISTKDYIEGVKEERKAELKKMIAESGFPQEKVRSTFKVGDPFAKLIRVVKDEVLTWWSWDPRAKAITPGCWRDPWLKRCSGTLR